MPSEIASFTQRELKILDRLLDHYPTYRATGVMITIPHGAQRLEARKAFRGERSDETIVSSQLLAGSISGERRASSSGLDLQDGLWTAQGE